MKNFNGPIIGGTIVDRDFGSYTTCELRKPKKVRLFFLVCIGSTPSSKIYSEM